MDQRINYGAVAPEGIRALSGLEGYVRSCGLEAGLIDLVKTRASQLNRCAYCIDMHTKAARAVSETEQRLFALSAWQETPFYTDQERAALAWTEAVTLISRSSVPAGLYEEARRHFSEKELVDLTFAMVAINGLEPARYSVPHRAGDLPAKESRVHRRMAGGDGLTDWSAPKRHLPGLLEYRHPPRCSASWWTRSSSTPWTRTLCAVAA